MSEQLSVSCENCVSACCRGGSTTMALTEKNVKDLREAGTELEMMLPADHTKNWGGLLNIMRFRTIKEWDPDKAWFVNARAVSLEPGEGLYGRKSDCGFLYENENGISSCSVHEDPELKPRVCEEFTAGSKRCLDIRARYGVDMDTEEINLNLPGVALGETALPNLNPPR